MSLLYYMLVNNTSAYVLILCFSLLDLRKEVFMINNLI
jgi:hypothetical protein